MSDPLENRFVEVFKKNLWQDDESVSGPGSRKDSLLVKRAIESLSFVIDEYKIKSLVDIPCGDFNWMSDFIKARPGIRYTGLDIVPELVLLNSQRHPGCKFNRIDITTEVPPQADLIFSKELLLHLQTSDILLTLSNMKRSGSKFLMLLNNFGATNSELPDEGPGSCRALDVCSAPFSYPAPIWKNDLYGLWRMRDLPDFFKSTLWDRLMKRPAVVSR